MTVCAVPKLRLVWLTGYQVGACLYRFHVFRSVFVNWIIICEYHCKSYGTFTAWWFLCNISTALMLLGKETYFNCCLLGIHNQNIIFVWYLFYRQRKHVNSTYLDNKNVHRIYSINSVVASRIFQKIWRK